MTERMNMLRVAAPESQRGENLPFDVERDITQEDWREMQKTLKEDRLTSDWESFCFMAGSMHILDSRIRQSRHDTDTANLNQHLEKVGSDKALNLQLPALVKLAGFPVQLTEALRAEIEFQLHDPEGTLHNRVSQVLGDTYLTILASIKILAPTSFSQIDTGKEINWDEIGEHINQRRNILGLGDRQRFASAAAHAKIIDSQKIRLSEEDWGYLHKELADLRAHGNWRMFAPLAAYMKILAADEVRVTDHGLEVTMRKHTPDQTPPIPDTLTI